MYRPALSVKTFCSKREECSHVSGIWSLGPCPDEIRALGSKHCDGMFLPMTVPEFPKAGSTVCASCFAALHRVSSFTFIHSWLARPCVGHPKKCRIARAVTAPAYLSSLPLPLGIPRLEPVQPRQFGRFCSPEPLRPQIALVEQPRLEATPCVYHWLHP